MTRIAKKKLTKDQAAEIISSIDKLTDSAFEDLQAKWTSNKVEEFDISYNSLRNKVIAAYREAVITGGYAIDLNVGLCLYSELNSTTGFTTVDANDDDVWRYISCIVFPDITYLRYPKIAQGDIRINKKRFYLHTRRIWIKTLWWYIHLSWQGSESATRRVLMNFGSDTISDLIERTGKGYRLQLYRELMKAYAGIEKKRPNFLNDIQKLNLVKCKTVEPALTEDAEAGFIRQLLLQLGIEGR